MSSFVLKVKDILIGCNMNSSYFDINEAGLHIRQFHTTTNAKKNDSINHLLCNSCIALCRVSLTVPTTSPSLIGSPCVPA